MMRDMMDGMMGGGGFGFLWMLAPLLFWGGLLAVVVWLVARIFPGVRGGNGGGSGESRDGAEEILRERFARGEIDAGEYERSLEILRTGSSRSYEDIAGEARDRRNR